MEILHRFGLLFGILLSFLVISSRPINGKTSATNSAYWLRRLPLPMQGRAPQGFYAPKDSKPPTENPPTSDLPYYRLPIQSYGWPNLFGDKRAPIFVGRRVLPYGINDVNLDDDVTNYDVMYDTRSYDDDDDDDDAAEYDTDSSHINNESDKIVSYYRSVLGEFDKTSIGPKNGLITRWASKSHSRNKRAAESAYKTQDSLQNSNFGIGKMNEQPLERNIIKLVTLLRQQFPTDDVMSVLSDPEKIETFMATFNRANDESSEQDSHLDLQPVSSDKEFQSQTFRQNEDSLNLANHGLFSASQMYAAGALGHNSPAARDMKETESNNTTSENADGNNFQPNSENWHYIKDLQQGQSDTDVKRAPKFVGKRDDNKSRAANEDEDSAAAEENNEKRRAPGFVGKRMAPRFVGKRKFSDVSGKRLAPGFVGKRMSDEILENFEELKSLNKRPAPGFVGKRRVPGFVGKRRVPGFVGKRRIPEFVGKRRVPGFVEKRLAPSFVGKRRVPGFVGKRFDAGASEKILLENPLAEKRPVPGFVGI